MQAVVNYDFTDMQSKKEYKQGQEINISKKQYNRINSTRPEPALTRLINGIPDEEEEILGFTFYSPKTGMIWGCSENIDLMGKEEDELIIPEYIKK